MNVLLVTVTNACLLCDDNVDTIAKALEPTDAEGFIFLAEQLIKLSDIAGARKAVKDGLMIDNTNARLLELRDVLPEIGLDAEAFWFDIFWSFSF